VSALGEAEGTRVSIAPEDSFLRVVNYAACPEVSLSSKGNQTVKLILFGRTVEGNRFHAHGLTVGPGVRLLELLAAGEVVSQVPGNNISSSYPIPRVSPEMVGRASSAQGGTSGYSGDSVLLWLL